jgi:hypothetical protein
MDLAWLAGTRFAGTLLALLLVPAAMAIVLAARAM